METGIKKAVRIAGGQSALAAKVGVRPQAVQQWVVEGKVPPRRCASVASAIGHQVSLHELNPDVYPDAYRAA